MEEFIKKVEDYVFPSEVYKADRLIVKASQSTLLVQLENTVFIKMVLQEKIKKDYLQSDEYGAQLWTSLNHPNILRCFQAVQLQSELQVTVECDESISLREYLHKRKCLDEQQVCAIIADITIGLCYLARVNVIHTNLNTSNIFVNEDRAKIGGLGFSQRVNYMRFDKVMFKDELNKKYLTKTPEGFVNGLYGHKTDIWAFGAILYELTHGKQPQFAFLYENDAFSSLTKQNYNVPLRDNLSFAMKRLICDCFSVEWQRRSHVLRLALGWKNYLKEMIDNRPQMLLKERIKQKLKALQLQIVELDPNKLLSNKDLEDDQRQELFFVPSALVKSKEEPNYYRRLLMSNKLYLIQGVISFRSFTFLCEFTAFIFNFLQEYFSLGLPRQQQLMFLQKRVVCLILQLKQKIVRRQIVFEGVVQLRAAKSMQFLEQFEVKVRKCINYQKYDKESFGFIGVICKKVISRLEQNLSQLSSKLYFKLCLSLVLIYHINNLQEECFKMSDYSVLGNYSWLREFNKIDLVGKKGGKKEKQMQNVVKNGLQLTLEGYQKMKKEAKVNLNEKD